MFSWKRGPGGDGKVARRAVASTTYGRQQGVERVYKAARVSMNRERGTDRGGGRSVDIGVEGRRMQVLTYGIHRSATNYSQEVTDKSEGGVVKVRAIVFPVGSAPKLKGLRICLVGVVK